MIFTMTNAFPVILIKKDKFSKKNRNLVLLSFFHFVLFSQPGCQSVFIKATLTWSLVKRLMSNWISSIIILSGSNGNEHFLNSFFFFFLSGVVFTSSTEDSIQIRSHQIEVLLIGLKIDQLSESAGSSIAVAYRQHPNSCNTSQALMWLYGD